MASTSVHLSPELVAKLDELASQRGTSRNRVIVEACQAHVEAARGSWPAGFFDRDLPEHQLALLQQAGAELEQAIYATRRERPLEPL